MNDEKRTETTVSERSSTETTQKPAPVEETKTETSSSTSKSTTEKSE
jgi:hypothetical protein